MRHDLNEYTQSAFPRAQAPYVYAMDPISRAVLESKKRTARAQAIVLGDEDMVDIARTVRVIANKEHSQFGEAVPQEVIDDDQTSVMSRKE